MGGGGGRRVWVVEGLSPFWGGYCLFESDIVEWLGGWFCKKGNFREEEGRREEGEEEGEEEEGKEERIGKASASANGSRRQNNDHLDIGYFQVKKSKLERF